MRGVIHDIDLVVPNSEKLGMPQNNGIAGQAQDAIRRAVAVQFWGWFDQHRDDVIYTVKVWIISKAIRVQDIRVIFERLFGSHP